MLTIRLLLGCRLCSSQAAEGWSTDFPLLLPAHGRISQSWFLQARRCNSLRGMPHRKGPETEGGVYPCSAMAPQHPQEHLPWRSRGLNSDRAAAGGCSPAGLGLPGRPQPLTGAGATEMGSLPAGGVRWGTVCVGAAQRSCRRSAGCTASGMAKRRLDLLWDPAASPAQTPGCTEGGAGRACAYQVGKWRLLWQGRLGVCDF